MQNNVLPNVFSEKIQWEQEKRRTDAPIKASRQVKHLLESGIQQFIFFPSSIWFSDDWKRLGGDDEMISSSCWAVLSAALLLTVSLVTVIWTRPENRQRIFSFEHLLRCLSGLLLIILCSMLYERNHRRRILAYLSQGQVSLSSQTCFDWQRFYKILSTDRASNTD